MVEIVSDKFICIVDESKLTKGLGPNFPLPVEITPFCYGIYLYLHSYSVYLYAHIIVYKIHSLIYI